MRNPAYELATIFDGWSVPGGQSPAARRQAYAASIDESAFDVTNRAMRCLVAIAQRIDQLERLGLDVQPMRQGLPEWQAGILSADQAMGTAVVGKGTKPAIRRDSMVKLQLLGALLDAHALGLQPTPDAAARVVDALDRAEAAIGELDMNESLRHHLLGLLARVREALAAGHAGDYTSAVAEFVGALHVAEAADPDPERRSAWRAIRDDTLVPIMVAASGNLLSAGMLMLGGG